MLIIVNNSTPIELVITELSDQVNTRFISQLINDISRVLQKLLRYLNETAVSASLVLSSTRALPVILAFNLKDSEFVISLFDLSL